MLVEKLCGANEESVIFDLFCGTGTIGLSIAKNTKAKRVVGFEIVESAGACPGEAVTPATEGGWERWRAGGTGGLEGQT